MQFEMLSHTSEAKFRAYGKTEEERFSNAALAMFSIMFDMEKVGSQMEKKVDLTSEDSKSLLHDWLQELLFLLDSELFVLADVKEMKITATGDGWLLNATVAGQIADDRTVRTGSVVKAVTYDEMIMTNECVEVVVDV